MAQAAVHIHAGGHRTGSSAFQLYLDVNAAAIRAQGVDPAYPNRDGADGGRLRLRLPAPRHGPQQIAWRVQHARRNLARHNPDPSRALLISEENIIGRMNPFMAGRFFPNATDRAAFMAQVLDGRKVGNLLLLVRSYDEVFISGFRKRAEEHGVQSFSDARGKMADFTGSWVQVARDLQSHLRPERLIVVPYARQRRDRDLLHLVCPALDSTGFAQPAAKVNASLSDIALFALQERYHAGEPMKRAVVEELREAFKGQKSDAPFAAFTQEQAERLQARYQADLEELRGLQSIDFVTPETV